MPIFPVEFWFGVRSKVLPTLAGDVFVMEDWYDNRDGMDDH
jgi:hypothetical protein